MKTRTTASILICFLAFSTAWAAEDPSGPAAMTADTLEYKAAAISALARQIPAILATYDSQTGRFGSGIWIVTDQNPMYALAVAYAIQGLDNPYHKDEGILDAIMRAGDALIEDADEKGMWEFRKKDGSTWGQIWMPWTYSRWIRAFMLIEADMPDQRRQAWRQAFDLAFTGISSSALRNPNNNIATHHAMGLYFAGKTLDRPQWREQAGDFLARVAAAQSEGGYWCENSGPVVNYNFVYVDALGAYYQASGDRRVLPALANSARFHYHFCYPDGSSVETIDERNPYRPSVDVGNVGFSFSSIGRAYLQRQWAQSGFDTLPADLLASLVLFGEEGPTAKPSDQQQGYLLVEGGEPLAQTIRQGPWFLCLSAYTAPIPKSRWVQDRQNLLSIFHEDVGLILGGGNTKLQPAWSNFTVGDTSLLQHQPGDTNPVFLPKPQGQLYHVPSQATLLLENASGLRLQYGPETCTVLLRPKNDRTLEYVIEATTNSGLPVAAHLTLLPRLGRILTAGSGETAILGNRTIEWSPSQLDGQLTYGRCRLTLPRSAALNWPALPHVPYRADGRAEPQEGRIEIRIPFDKQNTSYSITIEIIAQPDHNSPAQDDYDHSVPSYR